MEAKNEIATALTQAKDNIRINIQTCDKIGIYNINKTLANCNEIFDFIANSVTIDGTASHFALDIDNKKTDAIVDIIDKSWTRIEVDSIPLKAGSHIEAVKLLIYLHFDARHIANKKNILSILKQDGSYLTKTPEAFKEDNETVFVALDTLNFLINDASKISLRDLFFNSVKQNGDII